MFAAVCPQLGQLTSLILPLANTEMMALFLAHVAHVFSDSFIILLVDRVGWRRAQRLVMP